MNKLNGNDRMMTPSLLSAQLSSLTVMSSESYDSEDERNVSRQISLINTSSNGISSVTYVSETLDQRINTHKIKVPAKLSRPMHANYSADILAEYVEDFDRDILDDLGLPHDEDTGNERRGSKILREALENNRSRRPSVLSSPSLDSDDQKLGNDYLGQLHTASHESVIDYIDGYDLAVELRLRMKRTGLIADQDFIMV
jgi:hypothetical protein